MRIGINTDNYRLENRNLEYCFDSIRRIGAEITELNMVHGFDFFEGVGFSPGVSLFEDPLLIKEKAEKRGLSVSCIDCHYPIWSYRCIEYLRSGILFADQLGAEGVATTDADQMPEGMSEEEAFAVIKYTLGEVLGFAERHKIPIYIEPHGRLTNNPDKLMRILTCHDSPYLRVNFDTANTFVCGWEPAEFISQVIDKVSHCHVKDVAEDVASQRRGEDTGIAASEVSVGDGVNADNIVECLRILKKHDYKGVLSIEACGEALTEASFKWLSEQVAGLV